MPPRPRVAALDPGKARIGVAVADELGMMAHPRSPVDASNLRSALAKIVALAQDEGITRFLVGLPVSLSGHEGQAAQKARGFAQKVADATGCDVELVDERLSTVQAQRSLRDSGVSSRDARGKIDGAAACVILQAWLDGHAGGR
jgi:putative Holliday junction resolvase